MGQAWKWCMLLLLTFHWKELCLMATPIFKGVWKIQQGSWILVASTASVTTALGCHTVNLKCSQACNDKRNYHWHKMLMDWVCTKNTKPTFFQNSRYRENWNELISSRKEHRNGTEICWICTQKNVLKIQTNGISRSWNSFLIGIQLLCLLKKDVKWQNVHL